MRPICRMIVTALAAATVLAALPATLLADSHEEPAPARPYAYGVYYVCDTSVQEQADELVKNFFAPVYDQGVEDGTINGWGWMAHAIGGKWRRVMYMIAPTLDGVIEASNKLNTAASEAHPLQSNRLQQICPSHDDYIWRLVAGSDPSDSLTEQRGDAAISTYWVCDMAKEADVDKIVSEVVAPLWNEQVAAGNLASWAWFEHVVGGEYRRLASLTAKDFTSAFKAREAVIGALFEKHPEAMAEFSSSCTSHQDYLWDVVMETP